MRIAVIGGTGVVGRHTVSTRPDQSGRVVPGADSIGDVGGVCDHESISTEADRLRFSVPRASGSGHSWI
jgi:hypothetical protein